MRKIAILQSNYLPWKGVFDMIQQVDTFVFLEDVQYTEHDWRNRNKVKTSSGEIWITVPVQNSGRRKQLILEAEIDQRWNWQKKHYNTFQMNYAKAPYYYEYKWIIEELYINRQWDKLSDLNIYATKLLAQVLGIETQFVLSTDLDASGQKDDRVIDICEKLGGTYYLSGPAGKNYIIPEKFAEKGIELAYMDYTYPTYKQVYEPFNHYVTVLDVIFNCGPDAPYYIWAWRRG